MIELNEKQKSLLRFVLMCLCATGMVYEVTNIRGYAEEISSPEFVLGQNIPEEVMIDDSLENIDRVIKLNSDFYTKEIQSVEIPYNPISKAIWSMVNLQFYLLMISLLWKREN